MTRPRHRKYQSLEAEFRRTRRKIAQMYGQQIPLLVKVVYQELYPTPDSVPLQDQGLQGRRKHTMVESDPTPAAVSRADFRRKRQEFDQAIWMLTDGVILHLMEGLKKLAHGVVADDDELKRLMEKLQEQDIYQRIGKAAPTIGSYSQRAHAKLLARNADRQEWLEGQDNWKVAGIE